MPYVDGYKDRWNNLLKWKLHIQKMEQELRMSQEEYGKIREKIRSLAQRIGDEKRGLLEAIK